MYIVLRCHYLPLYLHLVLKLGSWGWVVVCWLYLHCSFHCLVSVYILSIVCQVSNIKVPYWQLSYFLSASNQPLKAIPSYFFLDLICNGVFIYFNITCSLAIFLIYVNYMQLISWHLSSSCDLVTFLTLVGGMFYKPIKLLLH